MSHHKHKAIHRKLYWTHSVSGYLILFKNVSLGWKYFPGTKQHTSLFCKVCNDKEKKILQTIQIDQLVSEIKTVFLFFENISSSVWGVLKTYPFQEISKFFVKKNFFDDDHHIKIISFDKTSKELNLWSMLQNVLPIS